MEIDALISPVELLDIPGIAGSAEKMGFGAVWTPETTHDPFLVSLLAAEHTGVMKVGTAVAISFARSPTTIAYSAWDLAKVSRGRFILGLGTQVKAHITRRFGMPWPESVVNKMREQIYAIRSIWKTWQAGVPLRFRGEYYKLGLMSPFFNPGPIENPDIPIYIAGVNPGLARLAGEAADGFHIHPLHSRGYLEEVMLPAFKGGFARRDPDLENLTLTASVFVVNSGKERNYVRSQIAFYASTPSYRTLMAFHGWEEQAEELSRLAARAEWEAMPGLVNDRMLEAFTVDCDEKDLPEKLWIRYNGIVKRINLYKPFFPGENDEFWENLICQFREVGWDRNKQAG